MCVRVYVCECVCASELVSVCVCVSARGCLCDCRITTLSKVKDSPKKLLLHVNLVF